MSRVTGIRVKPGGQLEAQEQNWPAGFALTPLCREKSYLKQFAWNVMAGNSGTGQPGTARGKT